jgi:hypothetical protein
MKTRAERVLVAYAVMGERIQAGDMYDGLWDFLRPLAASKVGERFIPADSAKWLSDTYSLHMPVIVMEGLAERMTSAQLLDKQAMSGKIATYVYKAQASMPRPTEADLSEGIANTLSAFAVFAKSFPSLASIDDRHLEEALFERLLNVDSLQILSHRDGQVSLKASVDTLTLIQPKQSHEASDAAHLDYVFGRFLLQLQESNAAQFDMLARIADAALVAEALATYRDPPHRGDALDGLELYLDGPLCLDILGVNVGREDFGREFLALLKSSGARLHVFSHTIEEIERVLEAKKSGALNAPRYATERTVEPPAIRDRVRALAGFSEAQLEKVGVNVVDGSMRLPAPVRGRVGAGDEQAVRLQLKNQNAEALETDVRTVCELMRLRTARTQSTRISEAGPVLVTRNTSLSSVANVSWRRYLETSDRFSAGTARKAAPISVSERRMCGVAWITSGGNVGEISRRRLVANCAAATSVKRDVITKVLNVLREKSPSDQDVFRAVISDQRAERTLMDATLGDYRVVTDENVLDLLQSLKEATVAEQIEKTQAEIAALKQHYEAENAALAEQRRNSHQEAVDLQFRLDLAEEQNRKRFQKEHATHVLVLEGAARQGRCVYRWLPLLVAVPISVIGLIAQVQLDQVAVQDGFFWKTWKPWVVPGPALILSLFLAWDIPDSLFGGWRQAALLWLARRHCEGKVPEGLFAQASFDFKSGTVRIPSVAIADLS